MTIGQYEQIRAENQRTWAARRKKKEELERAAAITLAGFESVVVGGRDPVGDREQWIKSNPEMALAYVDTLMKLGQYWDGTRLYEAVDTAADKIP